MLYKTIIYTFLLIYFVSSAAAAECPPDRGVGLQILGSGGPIADDGRASSGYLVWVDGQSRALIDAGAGVFLRFGEAGARFAELDFIGLSHLHTDHSAALPALLKSGSFAGRKRPIALAGPGGGGPFPGTGQFVESMLSKDGGAYAYLGGFLDGQGRLPLMAVQEVGVRDPATVTGILLPDGSPLAITAIPVPHGIVPALGFRVDVNGLSVVFASDQNGSNEAFTEFAKGADVLVMHLVIPATANDVAKRLHATPDRVGRVAAAINPRMLVLSHFMARSLKDLDDNVAAVKSHYDGPVHLANDLDCIALTSLVDAESIRLN